MIISISDVRRAGNDVFFSYFTNADKKSLCELTTQNGVSMKSLLFHSGERRQGHFSNVNPKQAFRLRCSIGDDVSSKRAVFLARSEIIEVPRDSRVALRDWLLLIVVVLVALLGIGFAVLLFKDPDLFDVFFAT